MTYSPSRPAVEAVLREVFKDCRQLQGSYFELQVEARLGAERDILYPEDREHFIARAKQP